MIPSFSGYVIRGYSADWSLHFTAGPDQTPDVDWEIIVETAITVTPHAVDGQPGEPFVVEVEVPAEQASPFFSTLPGKRFVELRVGEESELILELEDMTLIAPADPQYESWAVLGSYGEGLQCFPDREVGYAPPHPPKDTPATGDTTP